MKSTKNNFQNFKMFGFPDSLPLPHLLFLVHLITYLFPLACLGEKWDYKKKKGDPAAIAEDKKKKKKKKKGAKKGKGKTEQREEGTGDGSSEGEKAAKKKSEKKVKKKKSKVPVQKMDGGLMSDEQVQPQVPLPRHKTEL